MTKSKANNMTDKNRWDTTRKQRLKQRQEVIAAIRQDLYTHDFLEAETPLLVKGTCPDAHIDSIEADGGYLVPSTEYQIKRMIVGGFEKVFTLTKNFRANDRGRYHSTEFTMLEWARAHETLGVIEEDAVRFMRKAFGVLHPGKHSLIFNGQEIDFMQTPWERLTVRDALQKHLGLKNLEDFSLKPLCRAAKEAHIDLPTSFQEDKYAAISYLMALLQPHLGNQTPTFLQEWPSYMTTSAPISAKDPHAAERSELFIAGVEIADGFPFLRDAKLQRSLFVHELERRKEQGKPAVVLDEFYLQALSEGLPNGAGMALGMDRLVMVLTGAAQLSDVQSFDWDEL